MDGSLWVILPTYNEAENLEAVVGGVRAAAPEARVLVVDDGSTDGTDEVLAECTDPRLRVLRTEHAGVSAARNTALAVARGELVAYLDTDNLWSPQFLEVMVGELRDTDVAAYCGRHLFLMDGPLEDARVLVRRTHSPAYNPAALLRGNSIDLNVLVHRRALVDEVGGFDEELRRLVDWDLVARIALRHPFAVRHVDQVLCDYHYYQRDQLSSITNGHYGESHLRSLFGLGDPDEATARVLGTIAGELDLSRYAP
jgi:glycosyltransferase involved in cell wall biosynthesis